MSIRFAGPLSPTAPRMSADLVRRVRLLPANDDGVTGTTDANLHAALRHFARHGLAAAQNAREQAVLAARAGDRQSFQTWLEICRVLDRRLARRLDRNAFAAH